MKENGIAIDDMYTYALAKAKDIQQKANVHYTRDGSKWLAAQVAKTIEEALPKK